MKTNENRTNYRRYVNERKKDNTELNFINQLPESDVRQNREGGRDVLMRISSAVWNREYLLFDVEKAHDTHSYDNKNRSFSTSLKS